MSLCNLALEQIIGHFSDSLTCTSTTYGYYLITTPLLYPDRDHIQLFIKELSGNRYLVSDLGQTMMKLSTYGFEPHRTPRRRAMIFQITSSFSIRFDNGRFFIIASGEELGAKIWDLLLGVHKAADLVFTVGSYTKATFADEFENFVSERRIEYERGKQLDLLIGTTENVDFWVNDSPVPKAILLVSASTPGYAQQRSDRVYRTFNELNLANYQASRLSIIDDRQDVWGSNVLIRLRHVSRVILWTRTREVERALASTN